MNKELNKLQKEKMKMLIDRIPESDHTRLSNMAKKLGITRTKLVAHMVDKFLKEQKEK